MLLQTRVSGTWPKKDLTEHFDDKMASLVIWDNKNKQRSS